MSDPNSEAKVADFSLHAESGYASPTPYAGIFKTNFRKGGYEKLYTWHEEKQRLGVGKYDRANDRSKLAKSAVNVGCQYWTDDRSRLGW